MRSIILIILITFTCNVAIQDKKNSETLIVIPFAKKIHELSEIKCSQFIDNFEYIQLETNGKCLIGDNPELLVLKDQILIYQLRYCFVFDRKTGKFLYELGHYGRGPGEYDKSMLTCDLNKSIVYSGGWNYNMMRFSLDGKFLGSFPIPNRVPIPDRTGDSGNPSIMFQFSSLQNSLMIGYSTNITGSENKLLTIFNQKGEVVKVFPNRNIYPKQKIVLNLVEAQFYQLDHETFFKETYTDTLFKVTEKDLIPHIVFEMAEYSVPYISKWWTAEQQQKAKYIVIRTVIESNSYVILRAIKELQKTGIEMNPIIMIGKTKISN